MTKPTGRKRGRPKTKEYKTILARIPQELHDQVTQYATRHQQSISELIRDGLTWRLDEGDPHQSRYRAELAKAPLHPGLVLVLDESDVIQDSVSVIHEPQQKQSTRKVAQTDPAAARMPPTEDPPVIHDDNDVLHKDAAYDTSKYGLGALCVHRHEHENSGQSLRRLKDNECLGCQQRRQAMARERKRQGAPVT